MVGLSWHWLQGSRRGVGRAEVEQVLGSRTPGFKDLQSLARSFRRFGGSVFFSADDGVHGMEP